jgi:general stress protein YciG
MSADNEVSEAATAEPKPKRRLGFSAMPKEKQLELASKGGKASHNPAPGKKRGHTWTKETAREAGRRGGLASNGGRGKGAK